MTGKGWVCFPATAAFAKDSLSHTCFRLQRYELIPYLLMLYINFRQIDKLFYMLFSLKMEHFASFFMCSKKLKRPFPLFNWLILASGNIIPFIFRGIIIR